MEKGISSSNHPQFTGASQINVDLPEDATPLNFLDLFLDDEFYEHFTFQTNLMQLNISLRMIFYHAILVLDVGKRLL